MIYLNNEIVEKENKMKLYLSLLNLLRLRGLKINDEKLNNNNKKLMQMISVFSLKIDYDLLRYFYTYLYNNFDSLYNSYIYFGNNDISIFDKNENSNKIGFDYRIITKTDGQEVPIKMEESNIVFDKNSKKLSAAKNTYYSTSYGVEMIKLETDKFNYPIKTELFNILNDLENVVSTKVVFRNFYDYLLLIDVDINNDNMINYYENNIDNITKIVKDRKVTLDEHINNYPFDMKNLRNRLVHGVYSFDTINSLTYLHYLSDDLVSSLLKSISNPKEMDKYLEMSTDYDKKLDNNLRQFLSENKVNDAYDVVDVMLDLERKKSGKDR